MGSNRISYKCSVEFESKKYIITFSNVDFNGDNGIVFIKIFDGMFESETSRWIDHGVIKWRVIEFDEIMLVSSKVEDILNRLKKLQAFS